MAARREADRGATARGSRPAAEPALDITCWGTRGSIPVPGPETVRFGGNTSCLEVRAAGRLLIFDAGTGLWQLGRRLVRAGQPVRADLFLTHFHWDHVQGFPFFEPLRRADTALRIHASAGSPAELPARLRRAMKAGYFPVPADVLVAKLEFVPIDGRPWRDAGLEVASISVRHPQGAYGFRVRQGQASMAYIPDNELVGGEYAMPPGWHGSLVEFLRGVDILYHDSMYTEAEYTGRQGWGHSTFQQAVRLAEDAGVRRLSLFHHAPERTDAELLEILAGIRAELERRGSPLQVELAAEGVGIAVPGGGT